MHPAVLLAAMALAVTQTQSSGESDPQRIEWNRPFAPFRILGNVHYVGTRGLSAYLISDPTGHILIDAGLPESAPQIAAHIEALGFKLRDIRVILINHAHYDHSGGLAEMKRRTGAPLWASAGDAPYLRTGKIPGRGDLPDAPPVAVDRVISDGAVVRVGNSRVTILATPGHTRGCTSFSTIADGKRIVFACSLTVAGQNLAGEPTYPGVVRDYRATFAQLRATKADVMLSFHPDIFDMERRRSRQIAGDTLAFVDKTLLARTVERFSADFEKELAKQQRAAAKR